MITKMINVTSVINDVISWISLECPGDFSLLMCNFCRSIRQTAEAFSPCTKPIYFVNHNLLKYLSIIRLSIHRYQNQHVDGNRLHSQCLLPGGNNIFCFVSMQEIWISFMWRVDKPLWSPSRGYPLLLTAWMSSFPAHPRCRIILIHVQSSPELLCSFLWNSEMYCCVDEHNTHVVLKPTTLK